MAVQQQAKQLSQDWLSQISNYFTPPKSNTDWSNYFTPPKPNTDWSNYDNQMKNNSNQYYQQARADANFQYERLKGDTRYETQQARGYEASKARRSAEDEMDIMRLAHNLELKKRQNANEYAKKSSVGVVSGNAFGKYSAPMLRYGYDGFNNTQFDNTRRVKDYQFQRDQATQTALMISKAEAAGDILRGQEQTNQQKDLLAAQTRNEMIIQGRQASLEAQRLAQERMYQSRESGANRAFQSKESAADRAQRDRLAQLDAATRLYQSMWGSFSNNGNGGGFQYWGGSI